MKRLLTLALVLVALGVAVPMALAGLSAAQERRVGEAPALLEACKDKKIGDTVKVGGRDTKCPPRVGVRDPGTPADLEFIEAVAAACEGKKTSDTVKVGRESVKCPAGISVGDPGTPAQNIISCHASSSWPGWERCCEYAPPGSPYLGWQLVGCWWTQM